MAVVVDEFGAMLGVVTFADVLEAIAGDIPAADPGSAEGVALPASFRMERDGSILIDGTQPVDDLIEELNLRVPPERSFKTVAGLVVSQARRLPAPGERLSFDGFTLEVVAADNGAVTMVRLWRSPPSQTECHE
jgi:putative hemolysin